MQRIPLPHFGFLRPVRVCDDCVAYQKSGKGHTLNEHNIFDLDKSYSASAHSEISEDPHLSRTWTTSALLHPTESFSEHDARQPHLQRTKSDATGLKSRKNESDDENLFNIQSREEDNHTQPPYA